MTTFDMPSSGTFEVRGGWLVKALAERFALTLTQAAGIVGNLGYESVGLAILQEIKPAKPGSKGGYGWAQWTGPRRDAFMEWCVANRLGASSDQANYGYLCQEFQTTQSHSIKQLKLTTDLTAAIFTFGYFFERPGGTTASHLPGYEGRLSYAQRALSGAHDIFMPPRPIKIAAPAPSFWEQVRNWLGA